MADHSAYLEPNLTDFVEAPGFPHIRLDPALVNAGIADSISSPEEQLLLAMHCDSGRLLVISNKHIRIYEIPAKKSGLQKVGTVGLKVGLGFVPVVGELMDGAEKVKGVFEWGGGVLTGKKAREKAEDKRRTEEGMPTKKELEDLVWDLRDPEILGMILLYKDKILLRNGFEWKTAFKAPLETPAHEPVEITMDAKGIRFVVGRQKAKASFTGADWGRLKVSAALIEMNLPALQAAGWSVEAGDEKIVLKKSQ
jgi:hypothetical protein